MTTKRYTRIVFVDIAKAGNGPFKVALSVGARKAIWLGWLLGSASPMPRGDLRQRPPARPPLRGGLEREQLPGVITADPRADPRRRVPEVEAALDLR